MDPLTVTSANFTVSQDGVVLTDGIEYFFVYNTSSDEVTLRPSSGTWPLNHTYAILLNNGPGGVADLAGNPIAANRSDGRTLFTIFTGILRDFGDAPDPKYPTLFVNNGAAHEVIPGFHLGTVISEESDGKPTANADGDNGDDGVTFQFAPAPGVTNNMTVTAAIPSGMTGVLDAWFDLNQDGDWNDPGEKIISGRALTDGANNISYTFGSTSTPKGPTFARFRLTSTGSSSPTGVALNGEVEDYKVIISGPPFQNPNPLKRNDVNNDTFVSPIDAVLVINYLNGYSTLVGPNNQIPLPPRKPEFPDPVPVLDPSGGGIPGAGRYIDTNGDGFLSPIDVLLVLTELNAPHGNGGEGEGEAVAMLVADSEPVADDATVIPSVLLASPNVVLETREVAPPAQTVLQPMLVSQSVVQDLAILAGSDKHDYADAVSLVHGDGDSSLCGPLDDSNWDSLLGELASDRTRQKRM